MTIEPAKAISVTSLVRGEDGLLGTSAADMIRASASCSSCCSTISRKRVRKVSNSCRLVSASRVRFLSSTWASSTVED